LTLFVGGGLYLLSTGKPTAGYFAVGYAALHTSLSFVLSVFGRRQQLKYKRPPEPPEQQVR
jgi:hypothetical protein